MEDIDECNRLMDQCNIESIKLKSNHPFETALTNLKQNKSKDEHCQEHGLSFESHQKLLYHVLKYHPECHDDQSDDNEEEKLFYEQFKLQLFRKFLCDGEEDDGEDDSDFDYCCDDEDSEEDSEDDEEEIDEEKLEQEATVYLEQAKQELSDAEYQFLLKFGHDLYGLNLKLKDLGSKTQEHERNKFWMQTIVKLMSIQEKWQQESTLTRYMEQIADAEYFQSKCFRMTDESYIGPIEQKVENVPQGIPSKFYYIPLEPTLKRIFTDERYIDAVLSETAATSSPDVRLRKLYNKVQLQIYADTLKVEKARNRPSEHILAVYLGLSNPGIINIDPDDIPLLVTSDTRLMKHVGMARILKPFFDEIAALEAKGGLEVNYKGKTIKLPVKFGHVIGHFLQKELFGFK